MRTPVAVALVTVCLGLAGCSLFGKKQGAHTKTDPKPFLGAETPTKTETAAVPAPSAGPLPGANGLLAGQVITVSTGGPMKASIQVKDLEEEDAKTASLEVETNDRGYFTIPNLKVRGHYRLIARATEGGELVSNYVFVSPPNPTILLQLNKRGSTNTPPVPEPPKIPGKKGTSGTESSQERIPATTLDAPVKIPPGKEAKPREGDSPPPPPPPPSDHGSMGATQGSGTSSNISNIAQDFHRIPASAPAEIPGPRPHSTAPWPPPPPQGDWQSVPDDRSPPSAPSAPQPKPSGSVHLPDVPTRVPSCGLYGNRLDNFALYDLNGRVWEYKKDFRGRLLLLDFWYHTCPPCLQAIPHLAALQRDYGKYGLEVVSIACETGTVEQQRSHVGSIRGRYGINYTTLLSGGGPGPCPVVGQFQVDYFPCLVLIDQSGHILWRSTREGMDDFAHQKLKKMIEQRLTANRDFRTP